MHVMTQTTAAAQPVAPAERIQILDILRGFALFGIGMVNVANFDSSVFLVAVNAHSSLNPLDQVVHWLIAFFAEGKFYTLFSLLFGLGLAVQMARAEARGVRFVPLYLRRLLVLLLIGLAHATLVWSGDVLVCYAVLGCLLLLFRNRSGRTLLIAAGISLLIPILINAALYGLITLGSSTPAGAAQVRQSMAQMEAGYLAQIAQADQVYAHGTFAEATAQRLRDLQFMYPAMLFFAPNAFAMFLLGLYLGRRGVLHDVDAHLPFVRRARRWGLAIGLPSSLLYVVASAGADRAIPSALGLALAVTFPLAGIALCAYYISTLALLARDSAWHRRLAPLASVGRMTMTNYLLHSLAGALIFYGYGLGLYGQVSLAGGALLVLILYAAQVVVSNWWLARFAYGPAEWLWRSLTYLRWQPLRIRVNAMPVAEAA